jgi:hypothetical protein
VFRATPNRRAIDLIGNPSARCSRRISAQCSTVITPSRSPPGVKIQTAPRGQSSSSIDRPDSRSGEHRTFRLDRISQVHPRTGHFEVPPGFDPTARVLSNLVDAPRTHEVSVLIRATPARIATQLPPGIAAVDAVTTTHPTCPDGEPGWWRVRLHAERLDWVAAALAALNAPLVIEGPELLRDELLALATRLSARARRSPEPPI